MVSNLLSRSELYRGVFDRIYVFSPTAKTDPAWTILGLNEDRVYTSYSDELFAQVIREVRQNRDKGWMSLIVFDDLAGDSAIYSQNMTTPVMRYLMRARHDFVSMLFISQDLKLLPKKLRGQMTGWSLFHPPTKADSVDFAKQLGVGTDEKSITQMINVSTSKRFGFFHATWRNGGWVFSIGFESRLDPADFA